MSTSPKFLSLLKKTCKNCTKSTLKTYLTNIRRLYRLQFEGDVPMNAKWLASDALFKKYRNQPLKVRRHLGTAAIKAYASYEKDPKKYYKHFIDDQNAYTAQRAKHEKTPDEIKKWTSTKDLKKATRQLKQRLKHILEAPPSLKNMYRYQWYIVLKMFPEVPTRNDFATVELKKSKGNYLERPKKGSFILHFQKYKNSDRLGPKEIKLSRGMTMALRKYIKYRDQVDLKHDFLLTGKGGKPMTRSGFGKALVHQTKELLGKRIGSRIIRVVVASENKELLEKAAELSKKFLHSEKRTLDYVRK